jgi:hypothetical protein
MAIQETFAPPETPQLTKPSEVVAKNYNPISGIEVKELILNAIRKELDKHPDLTEVKAYPKAIIEFRLRFDIHQWPQEEDRHKLGEVWKKIRLDDIPPDAQRILNDMPVPTPMKVEGSGLDGGAVIVDQPVMATAEVKAAVVETFGAAVDTAQDTAQVDAAPAPVTAKSPIKKGGSK